MIKSKLNFRWFKENKIRCIIIFLSIIVIIAIGLTAKYLYDRFKQESKMLAKYTLYYEGDKENIKKTSEQKESFLIGVSNIPADKEPYSHDTEAGKAVVKLVYQPLVEISTDMEITNKVTDKLDFSDDGMSVTVKIKDIKFSDGKAVTADDVKNSYEYLCSAASGYYDKSKANVIDGVSEYESGLSENISGIDCVDESTVKFKFKENSAMNIMPLTLPIVKFSNDETYALGTGPYKVSKIIYTNKIDLASNDYCDENPYEYSNITLKTIPLNTLEKDISEFNLDMFYTNSEDVFDIIKDSNYHNVYKTRDENYYYLGFNFASGKSSDINLRKAVAFSLDRNDLAELFYAYDDKTIPLGITSTDKAKSNFTTEIKPDTDDAKDCLELSPSGFENLTYICRNDSDSYGFYEQIKSKLEETNINLSAERLDEADYNNRMAEIDSGSAVGDLYISSLDGLNPVELIEKTVSLDSGLKNEYEDILKDSYDKNPEELFENIEEFCDENVLLIPFVTSYNYIAVSADCDNQLMMELFY